jgi:hypothetical protein
VDLARRILLGLTLVAFVAGPVAGPLGAQQLEGEDLEAPPVAPTSAADTAAATTAVFAARLAEAEAIFASADQPNAIPLLDALVGELEFALTGPPEVALLVRALSLRAQAAFNVGDDTTAASDVDRLVVLDPSFAFDPAAVSPKLLQIAERTSAARVGSLNLVVDPSDSTVTVGGKAVDPTAPVAVLAGDTTISASRPGYAPDSRLVTVPAGAVVEVAVTLTRTAGVLWIATQPAGTRVVVDGKEIGVTVPTADGEVRGVSEAVAAEVAAGDHTIELSLADHRPQRLAIAVPNLADFRLEPIRLERAAGTVALRSLPAGVRVLVDQRATEAPGGRLELAPGRRRIAVDGGPRGQFEAIVDLADRENISLDVQLRPAVALAGILGGDRVAADRCASDLRAAFASASAAWTLLDRVAVGTSTLNGLGVDASVLRSESLSRRLDWAAVQRRLAELSPASLHLVGALSDDLVANAVELVLLPAAPAAPLPERYHLALGDPIALARLVAALSVPVRFEGASLGAELIDSSDGVLVANVRPGSPAEAGGLRTGDVVLALGESPVARRTDARRVIEGLARGAQVVVSVRSPAGATSTTTLSPTWGPVAARPDEIGTLYAPLAARVAAARQTGEAPPWVLDLNEAAVLLHARSFEDAIRRLRAIEAPSAAGLGREHADYWLGVALSAAGSNYREAAKEALERATRRPDATFGDADGPLVAATARARLATLTGP